MYFANREFTRIFLLYKKEDWGKNEKYWNYYSEKELWLTNPIQW